MTSKTGISLIIVAIILITGAGLFLYKKNQISGGEGLEEELIKMNFFWSNGRTYNNDYQLEVQEDGKILLQISSGFGNNKKDKEYILTEADKQQLENIITENTIAKWNGFDKSNRRVRDGESRSLRIQYRSGKIIEAEGYMRRPRNSGEGFDALKNFFNQQDRWQTIDIKS